MLVFGTRPEAIKMCPLAKKCWGQEHEKTMPLSYLFDFCSNNVRKTLKRNFDSKKIKEKKKWAC